MTIRWILILALAGLAIAQTYEYSELSEARNGLSAAGAGGKIFFGYGQNATGDTDTIDIYDVSTKTWSQTSYGLPRSAGSVASADGYVIFAGGFVNAQEVTIIKVATMTYSRAELSTGRYYIGAAGLGKRILFGGGISTGAGTEVDIFNTETESWSVSAFGSGVARSYAATAGAGDKILFAGGMDTATVPLSVVDIYDVSTDTWDAQTQLSVARTYASAGGAGDYVVIAGGMDSTKASDVVDIYNVDTGAWSTSRLSVPRKAMAATGSEDGKVYFAGGAADGNIAITNVDIFDVESQTWAYAKLRYAQFYGAAASTGIYERSMGPSVSIIAGGSDFAGVKTRDAAIFTSSTEKPARSTLAVFDGTGSIYFLGGEGGGPNATITFTRMDKYDCYTGAWSSRVLETPRKDGAAAYSNDMFVCVGGGMNPITGEVLADVETYNGFTHKVLHGNLSVARSHLAAFGYSGGIVFGGGSNGGNKSAVMDIFDESGTSQNHLSVARSHLAAARVDGGTSDGDAFFAGGEDGGGGCSNVIDIFVAPYTGTPITRILENGRHSLAGVALGKRAFFAGGRCGADYFYTDVEIVDSATGYTQTTTHMSYGRAYMAAMASSDGGFLAFAGGKGSFFGGILKSVEVFNINTGKWTLEELNVASYELSGAAVGDFYYVFGGKTGEMEWTNRFESNAWGSSSGAAFSYPSYVLVVLMALVFVGML